MLNENTTKVNIKGAIQNEILFMYLENLNLFKIRQHLSSNFKSIQKLNQFSSLIPISIPRKLETSSLETL